MATTVAGDTKVVRGIEMRRDPARDPCFEIVHLHNDVPDSGGWTLEARRQRLHREYNQEVQTLEVAALCLVDFPDQPWELRLSLARQCWDEARHAALLYRRLTELGAQKGQYPIMNQLWGVVAMLDSLPARLAVQHRTFEAGSMDVESQAIPQLREVGDDATADVKEAIDADEIPHIAFANEWLKRMTAEDPRAVLKIAAAMAWLRRVALVTADVDLHPIATDSESRALGGFSSAEIAEVARLERLVVTTPAEPPASPRDG